MDHSNIKKDWTDRREYDRSNRFTVDDFAYYLQEHGIKINKQLVRKIFHLWKQYLVEVMQQKATFIVNGLFEIDMKERKVSWMVDEWIYLRPRTKFSLCFLLKTRCRKK